MNLIKKNICYFFLLVSFSIVSQVDTVIDSNKKTTGKTVILAIPSNKIKKPISLDIKNDNGFKKAYDKQKKEDAKKKKENDLNTKGILSAAKISEERFLKSWKKINAPYPVIDQDLGSFRTQSKSVKIICRDFQYPDGDRVTILLNNIPVVSNIVLEQQYQSFTIPLEIGINKIAFVALNQGTSGPNTAAFKVYNDTGTLLSANEWNLATDAKATLVIAKDK